MVRGFLGCASVQGTGQNALKASHPTRKQPKLSFVNASRHTKGGRNDLFVCTQRLHSFWITFSNQVCHTDPRCHGFLPFQFQDILSVEVFLSAVLSVHMFVQYLWRPEEGAGFTGPAVIEGWSCHVAARNQTRIHCKQLVLLATEPSSLQCPPLTLYLCKSDKKASSIEPGSNFISKFCN